MIEKKVKYNFIYNALYQILAIAVPLITTPYLSRVLGPLSIGRYSYAYSIAYYFGLFILLGVNNYGCRSIALARKNASDIMQEFWNIYSIQFVGAIMVSIAYAFYFIVLANDSIIAGILMMYILSVGLDINWFFAGLEKFKVLVARNAAVKILTTASIFIFVKKQTDVYIYTVIMCIGFVISQMTLWIFFFKSSKFLIPQWKIIKKYLKPNIILFVPVLAISLFTVMDKIMLGYISGRVEVGYYESVEKVRNLPMAIINALGTVMLPYISNRFSKVEDHYLSIISKSIIFAMLCVTGMVFGLISIADIFVPIFYGQGYEKCILLYSLILPSCVFIAFANVIRTQFLIPQNKDKIYVGSVLMGAIVNMVLNIFLIPYYQSGGAAFATLCAEATVCFYQAYHVRAELPIDRYVIWMVAFSLIGIGMCIILRNIHYFTNNPLNELFIKVIIGMIYYMILLKCVFKSRKNAHH